MKALILGRNGRMGQIHEAVYREVGIDIVENDPDIVSVCTPDYLHGQNVIDALNAGCHVFCEKPLCTKMEQLDEIQRLSGKLKVGVNYPLRYHGPFINLSPNPIHFDLCYHYGRRHKLETGWRAEGHYSKVMGGMIHMVDLVGFITQQKMAVRGVVSGDDIISAMVTLDSGTSGIISCDFSGKEGHAHHVTWVTEEGRVTIDNQMSTPKESGLYVFLMNFDEYPDTFDATRTALEIDAQSQIR